MTSVKELEKLIYEKEKEIQAEETRIKLISHVDELNSSEFVKWLDSLGIKVEFCHPDEQGVVSVVLNGESATTYGYHIGDNVYAIVSAVSRCVFGKDESIVSRLGDVLGLEDVNLIAFLEQDRQLLISGSSKGGRLVRIDYKPNVDTVMEVTDKVMVSGNVFGPDIESDDFAVLKTEVYTFTGNDIFKKVQEKLETYKEGTVAGDE